MGGTMESRVSTLEKLVSEQEKLLTKLKAGMEQTKESLLDAR
jgi:uncharacterized coiled-coil protein SlyX